MTARTDAQQRAQLLRGKACDENAAGNSLEACIYSLAAESEDLNAEIAASEARREKRLRRLAKQKCCSLYKSRVRKTHCNNQGLYMLMNWYTGVVEGPNYEASLDLIEDYLLSH